MSKLVVILSIVFALGGAHSPASDDTLWRTVADFATCTTYERLVSHLRNRAYVCRPNPPDFHQRLIRSYTAPGTGVTACYVGEMTHVSPALAGYSCTVSADRGTYRSIQCLRRLPAGDVQRHRDSLAAWRDTLFSRAKELKSCPGTPLDMSFAIQDQVPFDLWKYYDHGIGMLMGTRDALMYLGVGDPTDYWEDTFGDSPTLSLLTFFEGKLEGAPAHPFLENALRVSPGIDLVFERENQTIPEVQRRLDADFRQGRRRWRMFLDMTMVHLRAEPSMTVNNLESVLRAQRVDFRSFFDDAWLDVEIELDLDELDVSDADREQMRRQAWETHGDTFRGIPQWERLTAEAAEEIRAFETTKAPGCRGGHLWIVLAPPAPKEYDAPAMYVMFAEGCQSFHRTRRTISRLLGRVLKDEVAAATEGD